MGFAEKVALHADHVGQEDIDELRALGLSDEEIFDVILAASARCFFAKALDPSVTSRPIERPLGPMPGLKGI